MSARAKITPVKRNIKQLEKVMVAPVKSSHSKINVQKRTLTKEDMMPEPVKTRTDSVSSDLESIPEEPIPIPILEPIPIPGPISEVEEPEPTSRPIPILGPIPEPTPTPTPTPTSRPILEPISEVEEPESDDESGYDLHPQLQEILQYLADDEHVSLIKGDAIGTLTTHIQSLQTQIQRLTEGLEELKKTTEIDEDEDDSGSGSDEEVMRFLIEPNVLSCSAYSGVTSCNAPTLIEPEPEPKPDPDPDPEPEPKPEPKPVDLLSALIDQYANTDIKDDNTEAIAGFNDLFEATFVYNFSGQAIKFAQMLSLMGIKNCIVIDPQLPQTLSIETRHRAAYYLKNAIDISKEKGYKTINIIADLTIVHNSFFEVFSYHMKALKTRNWDVLQYCCLDHKHTEQIQELDIDFYAKTNPDLGTTEIPCIRHHWNNYGILQGRVGAPHMVPTTSNNTLAFGLKNTVFSSIEKNIQTALGSKIEVGIFDFHGQNVQKLMMIPNLFILPKTGTQVCKTLRWHLSSYSGIAF
jgi:hypothetical protein